MSEDLYSDYALALDLTGVHGRGAQNAARHLVKLDSAERRRRAVSEGYTLMNLLGFRYSEAVGNAVSALLKLIEAGDESAELYGEKSAREHREKEAAWKEAQWAGFKLSR